MIDLWEILGISIWVGFGLVSGACAAVAVFKVCGSICDCLQTASRWMFKKLKGIWVNS